LLCGTWRRSLHRDHIIPKFKGGGDEPENIQLICANCHEDKTVADLTGEALSLAARQARERTKTEPLPPVKLRIKKPYTIARVTCDKCGHEYAKNTIKNHNCGKSIGKKRSGCCIICSAWRSTLHRDHIIPKHAGGSNHAENIQLLCGNCHEDKTVIDLHNWRPTQEQRDRNSQNLRENNRRRRETGRSRKFSSPSQEHRQRLSESVGKTVRTEEGRRKARDGQLKRIADNPERKTELVAMLAAINADPERRARRNAIVKAAIAESEAFKAAHSKIHKCEACGLVTTKTWIKRHKCPATVT
jgi:5-methylcytosine-specific restriction endonuclease McrA